MTKDQVIVDLENVLANLKADRNPDYYRCALHVSQDPYTGQWQSGLYTDDGFGNGNLIGFLQTGPHLTIAGGPADPWKYIQDALREYSENHPEMIVQS